MSNCENKFKQKEILWAAELKIGILVKAHDMKVGHSLGCYIKQDIGVLVAQTKNGVLLLRSLTGVCKL